MKVTHYSIVTDYNGKLPEGYGLAYSEPDRMIYHIYHKPWHHFVRVAYSLKHIIAWMWYQLTRERGEF